METMVNIIKEELSLEESLKNNLNTIGSSFLLKGVEVLWIMKRKLQGYISEFLRNT